MDVGITLTLFFFKKYFRRGENYNRTKIRANSQYVWTQDDVCSTHWQTPDTIAEHSGNFLYRTLHTRDTRPSTRCQQNADRQADRPFLWAKLSARCWESLLDCMPVASWCESRKTHCCFRLCWFVCHLFRGKDRLQEITAVENTCRDNDGKIQQCKNVQFKWKLTWKHCRLHYVISESKITDSKSKTVTNIFNIAHM